MKIAIFGAGGHGKVAADVAISEGFKDILFFDKKDKTNSINKIGTYCGSIEDVDDIDISIPCFIAIGDNKVREEIFKILMKKSKKIITLIHQSAIISPTSKIGKGVIVMPKVVVNSCTKISKGCILNTSSSIDHDCQINQFTHICPGTSIAGNVKIGKNSFIGIGSTVVNNVSIGSNVFVNGGSFVFKNISSNKKYKNIYK